MEKRREKSSPLLQNVYETPQPRKQEHLPEPDLRRAESKRIQRKPPLVARSLTKVLVHEHFHRSPKVKPHDFLGPLLPQPDLPFVAGFDLALGQIWDVLRQPVVICQRQPHILEQGKLHCNAGAKSEGKIETREREDSMPKRYGKKGCVVPQPAQKSRSLPCIFLELSQKPHAYLNRTVDDNTSGNSAGIPACALDVHRHLPKPGARGGTGGRGCTSVSQFRGETKNVFSLNLP